MFQFPALFRARRRFVAVGLAGFIIVLVVATAVAAVLPIDSFDNGSQSFIVFPGAPQSDTASGAGILGGERDIYSAASGSGFLFVEAGTATGILEHSQTASVNGYTDVTWDGPDGDPLTLDHTGLGGVDLTDGGENDGFNLLFVFADLAAAFDATVYTDAANYSTVSYITPASLSNQAIFVPFSSFVPAGGTGADWTNVGAIVLRIDGTAAAAIDVQLEFGETTARDFGDLPDSYNTTVAAGGPFHTPGAIQLGAEFDTEGDGAPSVGADGDDTAASPDDEDGIVPNGWLVGPNGGSIDATLTGGPGCLDGWVDWDDDGSFSLPAVGNVDHVIQSAPVVAGLNADILFDVPNNALPGPGGTAYFYTRFRLTRDVDGDGDCTDQTQLSSSQPWAGGVHDGEVEDYYWGFGPTAVEMSTAAAQSQTAVPSVALPASLLGLVTLAAWMLIRRRAPIL